MLSLRHVKLRLKSDAVPTEYLAREDRQREKIVSPSSLSRDERMKQKEDRRYIDSVLAQPSKWLDQGF